MKIVTEIYKADKETEKLHCIVVEWYKSKKDVELGKPYTVVNSGFSKDLALHEAVVLKSKMSDAPVCKMFRINKIKPVG